MQKGTVARKHSIGDFRNLDDTKFDMLIGLYLLVNTLSILI